MRLMSSVGRSGRNLPDDVRVVQRFLNDHQSANAQTIVVNGIVDARMIALIEHLQRRVLNVSDPSGLVSPSGPTWDFFAGLPAFLCALKWDEAPDQLIAWGRRVSVEFKAKVISVCNTIGIDPNDLMACMAFESGRSFSPSVKNNAGSGAIGLIQFMPSTADKLGTTTKDLSDMTPERQLDYVEEYFAPYASKLQTLDDLYMAILWPAAIGKPQSFVLFDRDDKVHPKRYEQNKGLDADRDGKVTKAEAAAGVYRMRDRGLEPANIG